MGNRSFAASFPLAAVTLFVLILLWVWGVTPTACGLGEVRLPSTGLTSVALPSTRLDISITRGCDVFVGSKYVDPRQLSGTLEVLARHGADRLVAINADSDVRYHHVAVTAKALAAVGFRHVYLRTSDQHISSLLFRQAHSSRS